MSNSVDQMRRLNEPSHLDLCCLQKPIIIDCGSERVKKFKFKMVFISLFQHVLCRQINIENVNHAITFYFLHHIQTRFIRLLHGPTVFSISLGRTLFACVLR